MSQLAPLCDDLARHEGPSSIDAPFAYFERQILVHPAERGDIGCVDVGPADLVHAVDDVDASWLKATHHLRDDLLPRRRVGGVLEPLPIGEQLFTEENNVSPKRPLVTMAKSMLRRLREMIYPTLLQSLPAAGIRLWLRSR